MSPIKQQLTRLTDPTDIYKFTINEVAAVGADALAEIARLEKELEKTAGLSQLVVIAGQMEAHLERVAKTLHDMYQCGITVETRQA